MSHREEAPRQQQPDKCPECGHGNRLNGQIVHAPSCNGSQQESQQLTGDDCTETPRTDEAQAIYNDAAGLFGRDVKEVFRRMRELELALSSLSRELEGVRKDAERYRWLKSGSPRDALCRGAHIAVRLPGGGFVATGEMVDEAIDAASAPKE
jgi:hypothetical protein